MAADTPEKKKRDYKILVYGIDQLALEVPIEPTRSRNFTLFFETYRTEQRLDAYDGVIVFQGIFEEFQMKEGSMSMYLHHTYDRNELDKRKKELALLLRKGGFVCFLLIEPFLDHDDGKNFESTDLAKYCLNFSEFHRRSFKERISHIRPLADEFAPFLSRFGAASCYFVSYNNRLQLHPIAKVKDELVGFLIEPGLYAIPALKPDNRPEVISEYFTLLSEALTSYGNKILTEIPDWLTKFQFSDETRLLSEREAITKQKQEIDTELNRYSELKLALVHSGSALVKDISQIFESGFDIRVDATDEFREDVKLKDGSGNVIAIGEIKGTNRGVKREHINQTDSHRDRSEFDSSFPALLIINTHIKNARSVSEKDQEIAKEQIQHACNMNVLIVRTLDLLGLLRLVLASKLRLEDATNALLTNTGWLRVVGDDVGVRKE